MFIKLFIELNMFKIWLFLYLFNIKYGYVIFHRHYKPLKNYFALPYIKLVSLPTKLSTHKAQRWPKPWAIDFHIPVFLDM